jgi:hypothetical protein
VSGVVEKMWRAYIALCFAGETVTVIVPCGLIQEINCFLFFSYTIGKSCVIVQECVGLLKKVIIHFKNLEI